MTPSSFSLLAYNPHFHAATVHENFQENAQNLAKYTEVLQLYSLLRVILIHPHHLQY